MSQLQSPYHCCSLRGCQGLEVQGQEQVARRPPEAQTRKSRRHYRLEVLSDRW